MKLAKSIIPLFCMKKHVNNLAIILPIILMLTACDHKAEKQQVMPVPMETPQALVIKIVAAMQSADRQAFLECISASKSEYKYLEVLLGNREDQIAFQSNFIKTYGEEAWIAFQDPEQKSDGRANMTFRVPTEEDVEIARQWQPEGSKPMFRLPLNGGRASNLTKLESGWIFEFSEIFGELSNKELLETAKALQEISDLVSRYSLVIGAEGISPEDIDSQMGKDMMNLMFGIVFDVPDNFDVEQIIKQNHSPASE